MTGRILIRLLGIGLCAGLYGCAATTLSVDEPPKVAASQPAGAALLVPFEKVVLENGATLMLARKADVPLVALSARLRGGAVTDDPERSGLASLTASLLEKGAAGRSAREFADAAADVGGYIGSAAGRESAQVSAEFLAEDTALMIEMVLDMLIEPRLPEDEFEKLRTRSIESIKAARDGDPRSLMGLYGAAWLFGDHVYGRAAGGRENTLAAITHEDVLAHHRDYYGSDRLVIAVVGDIDTARVRALLESRLASWSRARSALPVVPAKSAVRGRRVLLVDKPDATQSYFWMGNIGVSARHEPRAALDVANTLFGGRFTSMLNTALRIESGLTYGASSRLTRYAEAGSVAISSYTATESTVAAMDLARDTLTRFHTLTPSEKMLDSARNYLRGQHPLGYETARQMAGHLSLLAFYGRDRAYEDGYDAAVAAVDAQAMARVIDTVYPTVDDLVTVVIGNADAIRDELTRYGEVVEMPITQPAFSP